jgi:hypothetical protein
MADGLQASLDIEIAGAIDAASWRIGIFGRYHADVRRRWQIAFPIMRPQIMPSPLALPGMSAAGAKPLFGYWRRSHAGAKLNLTAHRRQDGDVYFEDEPGRRSAAPDGISHKMIIDATTPAPPDRRGSFGEQLGNPAQTDVWRTKVSAMLKDLRK